MKSIYPDFFILIVDDETVALESFEFSLHSRGITNTLICADSRQVDELIRNQDIGLVLLDILMPGLSGEELLGLIREIRPETLVIMITGLNDMETAVRCIRNGAYDYLVKPLEETRLYNSVRRAIEYIAMQREISSFNRSLYAERLNCPDAFSGIVTRSRFMFSLFRYAESVAPSPQPVLILGETGTGKELMAKAVHMCSGRKGEMVTVNIAGLDEPVFSDTLFGHVRGAFTGAGNRRPGLVEKAAQGTLFLDEIGSMEPSSQVKLLRLIQEREYHPVGSDTVRHTDVRIITATNQNIRAMSESGTFRRDLYFRLMSHQICLPPLRERPEDIPLLADYFLEEAARENNKNKPPVPEELYRLLTFYDYPGNIRELRAMIHNAMITNDSGILGLETIRNYIRQNRKSSSALSLPVSREDTPLSFWKQIPTVRTMTEMLITEAMRRTEGNRSLAADILGITRQTIAKYIKEPEK